MGSWVLPHAIPMATVPPQSMRVVAVPVHEPVVVTVSQAIEMAKLAPEPIGFPHHDGDIVVARLAEPKSCSSSGTSDSGGAHLTLIELRHGRKRVAISKQRLSSGAHVLVNTVRGNEIGTVTAQISTSSDETPRHTITCEVSDGIYQDFEKEASQDESAALFHARKVAAELGLPITFHCATMQLGRAWIILHFTTQTQERPDLRKLLGKLRSALKTSIWFNNCASSPGCPGEMIDPIYFVKA